MKPVNDVIALVETKEMARNALPSSALSAVSSLQRQKARANIPTTTAPSRADQSKEATCPGCKGVFRIFTEGPRGWNSKLHQVCIDCFRANRRKQGQRRPHQATPPNVQALESGPISQIAAFQHSGPHTRRKKLRHRRHASLTHGNVTKPSPTRLDHHIFTRGEWKRARLRTIRRSR